MSPALPDVDWQPLPWPEDGVDPFDPSGPATCWFAARNGGVSRAFPAGDWRDWGSWHDFARAVPVGYSVLTGEERLAVCLDGRVAGEWPTTGATPVTGCTVHHLEEANGRWYARTTRVPSYDVALADAVSRSRSGARRTIVSRVLRSTDWH